MLQPNQIFLHSLSLSSLKAPDDTSASVNFSLIAALVESPVVDEYVAVDTDRAEAELCGRFCVVLPEV